MSKKNKVYHNTTLLLRSYQDLKEHCSGSESLIKIENEALEDWYNIENESVSFEDYLKSVKKTKTRTVAMLKLVDRYLRAYKADAKRRNDTNKLNRWGVIDKRYISGSMTLEEISEEMEKDISSIKRYHKRAIDELGVYFFGIEGLKLEK